MKYRSDVEFFVENSTNRYYRYKFRDSRHSASAWLASTPLPLLTRKWPVRVESSGSCDDCYLAKTSISNACVCTPAIAAQQKLPTAVRTTAEGRLRELEALRSSH